MNNFFSLLIVFLDTFKNLTITILIIYLIILCNTIIKKLKNDINMK